MFGRRHSTDVVVIGAGPVGMTAGLLLTTYGKQVGVFEKNFGPCLHNYSPALHPLTLEVLHELGLVESVLAGANRVHRVEFYQGREKRCEIDLSQLDTAFPFVAMVGQRALENALADALKANHSRIHWQHRLHDFKLNERGDGVDAQIDQLILGMTGYACARMEMMVGKTLNWSADYILGTDGHDSIVRDRMGGHFERIARPEQFAIFDFQSSSALDANTMRVVIDASGTSVLWALAGGHWRWCFAMQELRDIVEAVDPDMALVQVGETEYPQLSEGLLLQLIEQRAPWFEGSIDTIDWRIAVQFENQLSDKIGGGPVWLAGDSAHQTTPIGLQSMNLGIQEAHDLAQIIAFAEAHNRELALREHGVKCLTRWKHLMHPGVHCSVGPGADPWVRRHAAQILRAVPLSGPHFQQAAAQLHIQAAGALQEAG